MLFSAPIEHLVPPPPLDGAHLRLIDLHRSPPVVRKLVSWASRRADDVRERAWRIMEADRAAIATSRFTDLTVKYRHVLELWVDGACELRAVGEPDPVTRLFGMTALSGSHVVVSAWPLPPRADDPAWTVPRRTA